MSGFGMKIYLVIFALLVGLDAKGKFFTTSVQVSPANPVQFWPVDCQTFNQKEVCGIFHRCWYAPWQCDDEIKNQFYDSISDDTNFETISDFPALSSFVSRNVSPTLINWTTGATPSVVLPIGFVETSESLEVPYDFIPGYNYRITVSFTTNTIGPGSFKLNVYDEDFNILATSSTTHNSAATRDAVIIFTATSETVLFGIVGNCGPGGVTITVNSRTVERGIPDEYTVQILDESGNEIDQVPLEAAVIEGTYDSIVVYSNSFIPSDYNICDERISLKLLKLTGSPDEEILVSDPLDIRVSHPCTNLIEYSNNRNYAGLIYDGISPVTTFSIRVKSIFHDEELPQEDFVMDLPQGVEKTGSVLTAQRLLKIHKVPEHQHKKIVLALNHQSVLIDGSYWTKGEKYEKLQKSNDRQPMRNAQVLLTQRDFLVRSNL